jgi:hypothetical protein
LGELLLKYGHIETTTEKNEKNGGFSSYLWTHLALVLSAAAAAVHVMLVV